MSFQQLPGQALAKRMLQNALRHNTLAHAYIFSGCSGTGRKRMAETLIKAIYCTENVADACGNCLECRKVENRNHPDVDWIEPDGTAIKIDQIRDVQKKFAYRSTTSGTKIYVLNEAERMTVQASNSLLKFLEEPNAGVIAILITENGHALLPTIRSRAQWVTFMPMNPDEIASLLEQEGHSPELARSAAHLTAGLDAARELIQSKGFAETRKVMIQLAKDSLSKLPSALLTVHNDIIKGEVATHLPILLDLWLLWFKDMICLRASNAKRVIFTDQMEWLQKQAFAREVSEWIYCMERIMEIRKRLRFHINPQLGLEQLAIDIQRG